MERGLSIGLRGMRWLLKGFGNIGEDGIRREDVHIQGFGEGK